MYYCGIMQIIARFFLFLLASIMACQSYAANKTFDVHTAVSQIQMDDIAYKYVNKLPIDNVTISSVNYSGTYVLNDVNQLTQVNLNQVQFSATETAEDGSSFTVDIQGRASVNIPKSNCTQSSVVVVDLKITHPLFNIVPQREQLIAYANVFMRDYVILQTNLVNYCAIKPKFFFYDEEMI